MVRLLLSPLPSLPYSGASLVLLLLLVAVAFLPVCPAPCLGGVALSLASVRLGYCADGLLLRSCPIVYFICFGFLVCVLLGRRFLASLDSGLAFILVHLLCDSVESQFLHDGVLPLGRVCSVSCCFCLFPVWAVFVLGPLHVLVVSPPLSSALGGVECPLRRLSPLGSSPSLSFP